MPDVSVMQKNIFTLLIFILAFFTITSNAQYYTSGADPASVKWKQINTDRFRLVFPEEFAEPATELALFLDSIAPRVEASLNHKPRKIDIIIHGRSTFSNGFVSWAPRRIELYPSPDQNNYGIDWLKQLAIHEYRHVVQIDKLRQGFTKVASWFTGEQATGAVLGAYLPMWFMEGDAVITETTLSESGRGRLPAFSQPLKARLSRYGYDDFDKAYLGSYKEFVPDYYKMGYHFTAAVRQRYGAEIWEEVIDNVGRNSWSLIPFREAIRKTGYRNQRLLYNAVFDSLATAWRNYDDTLKTSDFAFIARGNDDYTNIEYPVVTEQGDVFAQITGPGQRTRIVNISSSGDIETIAYTGSRNSDPITANERWVAWTEFTPHIRWNNADYSIVRVYDRFTKQTSTLTSRTRYFAPALKTGSDTMAVVENTTGYQFFITLIDMWKGKAIKRIPTPGNAFPMHPSWSDEKDELVLVLLSDSGKSIVSLNTKTNQWETLRKPAFDEPKYPVKRDHYFWYTASTQNSEEIFRTNIKTGITSQLTQSRFGATFPSLRGKDSLIYSNYTPTGYQLVKIPAWQTVKEGVEPADLTNDLVKKLKIQEPRIQTNYKPDTFGIRPYSKWNLINLHSWAPAYIDIDNQSLYPGLSLMSQNLLGTMITRAGYNAAKSKSREKFNIGLTYRGWFPIIDFDLKWGDYKESFGNNMYESTTRLFTLEQQGKENHISLEAGTRIPLDLSIGKWRRLLQFESRLSWQNISNRNYEQSFFIIGNNGNLIETGENNMIYIPDIDYWGMEYSAYFHNKLRGTARDVNTRWGQSFSFIFRHTPWGNYNAGKVYGISSRLYFPGIGQHHAIRIDNEWQNKINGEEIDTNLPYRMYQKFGDLLDLPRGYEYITNDNMYVFNGTYQMPLWNPDWSLPGLIYIKRFRLNLFFDAARAKFKLEEKETGLTYYYTNTFTSKGIELMSDFHAFRFVLPFSIGYRGGYRDADRSFFHEVVFSTSFDSFLINK